MSKKVRNFAARYGKRSEQPAEQSEHQLVAHLESDHRSAYRHRWGNRSKQVGSRRRHCQRHL